MGKYVDDKGWEETYVPQVVAILRSLLHFLVEISVADALRDKKYAEDFSVKLDGTAVSVRLRRPKFLKKKEQRDLTIRSRRVSSAGDEIETELSKIKRGCGFIYLTGWADSSHAIPEWMLVDINKLRTSGLLEKRWSEIPNRDEDGKLDGTYFIAIPASVLYRSGCLIAWELNEKALQPTRSIIERNHIHVNKKLEQDKYATLWEGIPA